MKTYIIEEIISSIEVKSKILDDNNFLDTLEEVAYVLVNTYKNGNKLLIGGNGGSAADAQHLACELVNKFYFDRMALPAIALTTDTSIITAIGNDYGYDNLFARQIQANGVEGDAFLAITTSGNSTNIIRAVEECKRKGVISIGLSGLTGGELSNKCDYCICVPSDITSKVQESHIMIGHILCGIIEKELCDRGEEYGRYNISWGVRNKVKRSC